MKVFGIYMLALFFASSSVFVVGKSVRYKPWVKTGQEEQFEAAQQALKTLLSPVDASHKPKLVCESTSFDFGVMNVGETGRHSFTMTNVGTSPLAVSDAGASCGCLSNDFGVFELGPGESRQVTLTWTPFERDDNFSKQQKIETNDPDASELLLTVHGSVHATLQTSPKAVVFERMLPGEMGRKTTFQIYSESLDSLEIDRLEVHNVEAECELLKTYHDADSKRAVAEFELIANSPNQPRQGIVRVFLRVPSAEETTLQNADDAARELRGLDVQPDGTILVEVPVQIETLRRLSLYSPLLETLRPAEQLHSTSEAKVELGKVFQRDSFPKSWALVGRIRGAQRPESISVELIGIPSLKARVETQIQDNRVGDSFRIVLESTAKIPIGIYDRKQAGLIRILTPGLPGEELLELPVTLDVLSNKERAK